MVESAAQTPVSTPAPAIDYSMSLPPLPVLPSTQAGSYSWRAELSISEVFDARNRLSTSSAVNYQVLAERMPFPSVTSISTGLARYRAGDTMVINYTTTKGTSTATYDLMLRLTSKATGKNYYFYDDE